MADAAKQGPTNGGALISDLRGFFSIIRTGRTAAFAYGLMFAFVVFTAFQAFNPSANAYSPWLNNIFSSGNFSGASSSSGSFGSQFPSFISYFLPNSSSVGRNESSPSSTSKESPSGFENRTGIVVSNVETEGLPTNRTGTHSLPSPLGVNQSSSILLSPPKAPPTAKNQTLDGQNADKSIVHQTNQTKISVPNASVPSNQAVNSSTNSSSSGKSNHLEENKKSGQNGETSNYAVQVADKSKVHQTNQTKISVPKASVPSNQAANSSTNSSSSGKSNHLEENKKDGQNGETSNYTVQDGGKNSDHSQGKEKKEKEDLESLKNCNFFNGKWVRDGAYPLYKPGSCSVIDEQFNCILNGRPDRNYQSLKWKPNDCSLPRLDGHRMLELLRGKRLVFVGDSLNRNMWESLVCILRNAARDRSKVFEAHGRSHFRGEVSYSFVFKDYNSSVEFFVSPFLVREWETPDKQGVKKETLRLDLVGKSSNQYKGADVIVFNTGHWWTHDKTSKGKDYYQEGSHVYGELNVMEAFRKALTTWARWVDANVDPMKSMVFFRGYSASHFSGGQWNSGGQCDSEIEPIKNETFLRPYPPKMTVLEKVMKGMKTQVTYLNITRMTDMRKDGHPSIYRKQSLSEEERRAPLTFQDCSHWCLPGVPDAWNEVLYAELLVKQYQKQQLQKKQ